MFASSAAPPTAAVPWPDRPPPPPLSRLCRGHLTLPHGRHHYQPTPSRAVSPGSRPTYLTVSEATQSPGSSRIPGDWSPKAAPASHLRSPLLLSHPVSITGSLCTSQPRPRHSGPIPGSRLPQPSACNPSLNLGSDHFPHPLATTGTSHLDYGSCPLAGLPSPTRVPLSAPHTGARGVFPKL